MSAECCVRFKRLARNCVASPVLCLIDGVRLSREGLPWNKNNKFEDRYCIKRQTSLGCTRGRVVAEPGGNNSKRCDVTGEIDALRGMPLSYRESRPSRFEDAQRRISLRRTEILDRKTSQERHCEARPRPARWCARWKGQRHGLIVFWQSSSVVDNELDHVRHGGLASISESTA